MPKRKIEIELLPTRRTKKSRNIKFVSFDYNEWISPSSIRNYVINDPLIDWLKLYGHNKLPYHSNGDNYNDTSSDIICQTFIMNKGIQFESSVMNLLYKKFPHIHIPRVLSCSQDMYNPEKAQQTLDLMKQGVPIIYQGVLHNHLNSTYGCPDLIVRSDWINKIVPDTIKEEDEYLSAPELYGNYHYRIIDIKFLTLPLKSNGQTILNSNSNIGYYKCQTILYNMALGYYQNYYPNECYIMGRGYHYKYMGDNFKGKSCFDRLGKVRWHEDDHKYLSLIHKSFLWIHDLRKYGHNWNILPVPSREELYPNMCNTQDHPFHQVKCLIAEQLKDITTLWQCGPKNRKMAFQQGVYRWDDPKCTSKLIGHNGVNISPIVQKMIELNRDDNSHVIVPDIIIDHDHLLHQYQLEIFLDIESLSNIFDNFAVLPHINFPDGGLIIIIGVMYIINNETHYKHFYIDQLHEDSERTMMIQFRDWIMGLIEDYPDHIIFHWGSFDPIMIGTKWEHFFGDSMELDNLNFVDLLKFFKKNAILIKGVFNFNLKNIVSAMTKWNLLDVQWPVSCGSGLQAMVSSWDYYNLAIITKCSIQHIDAFKDILEYNKIDCYALFKIIEYLRRNMLYPI